MQLFLTRSPASNPAPFLTISLPACRSALTTKGRRVPIAQAKMVQNSADDGFAKRNLYVLGLTRITVEIMVPCGVHAPGEGLETKLLTFKMQG
jgi:hypothetical protein